MLFYGVFVPLHIEYAALKPYGSVACAVTCPRHNGKQTALYLDESNCSSLRPAMSFFLCIMDLLALSGVTDMYISSRHFRTRRSRLQSTIFSYRFGLAAGHG
jgi:hypothetical protein